MAQKHWKNCPANVQSQITAITAEIKKFLLKNLAGIYLHGSLAMGCFNPNKSDLAHFVEYVTGQIKMSGEI